jgi:hypothetical protein
MVAGKTLAAFAGPFASISVSYYYSTSEMVSALFISSSFQEQSCLKSRQFLSWKMTLAV